ncbi:hypothetical protein D3C72_1662360 [compost metagenome]
MRRGQQWQQFTEGVATFGIQAQGGQLQQALGLQRRVAQLPQRSQQGLFAATELTAEGAITHAGGKYGGT